jgi:hypothetical protein
MTQEDVTYVVLTDDPNLQAYRTDRVEGVEPACPAEDGDIICEQVSYEPLLEIAPAAAGAGDDEDGGTGIVLVIVGAAVVGLLAFLFARSRARRDAEPLERRE